MSTGKMTSQAGQKLFFTLKQSKIFFFDQGSTLNPENPGDYNLALYTNFYEGLQNLGLDMI